MTENTEQTEEHKAAAAARKARIKAEREVAEAKKHANARRRVIDFEATAKRLLERKHVTAAWVNRQTPETFKRMIKVACVANEMDAVSLTGHDMPWHTVEYRF